MSDFPNCALPGCHEYASEIVHRHGRRLVSCGEHGELGNRAVSRLLDDDHEAGVAAVAALPVKHVAPALARKPEPERTTGQQTAFRKAYGKQKQKSAASTAS